jgi:uncharacterized damage-inducible protein DinB
MANAASEKIWTAAEILDHWQGHRRLTRRTIEAFPADKLFTYSIGGMRTFGELANEMIGMAVPVARGFATGEWQGFEGAKPASKEELLKVWDEQTAKLTEIVPSIPLHRFAERDKMFGQWEATGIGGILYAIDNEIHHRGQGFVYLRSLGVEPPPFWERN